MKRMDRLALAALSVGGLALTAMIIGSGWHYWRDGQTDFLSFYSGARLAFTPDLYDLGKAQAIQAEAGIPLGLCYIRMPWFAAALWPLGKLPYHSAYVIWVGLLLAAFVTFVRLWPRPALPWRIVILCGSLPAMISLQVAQDQALLLAAMAIGLYLFSVDEPVWAGVVLSLGLAKFHMFLPLYPAVLLARRWKLAGGLFGGSAMLVLISFAAGGWDWIQKLVSSLATSQVVMFRPPSLYPLFGESHRVLYGAMVVVILLAYLWRARSDVAFLIAAAPVVMMPVLPHVALYDCPLVLPLVMLSLVTGSVVTRVLAVALAFPLASFLHFSWNPYLMPVLMIGLVLSASFDRRRTALPRSAHLDPVLAEV
jgi:hypothetical protein